jgi:hypothetical protein
MSKLKSLFLLSFLLSSLYTVAQKKESKYKNGVAMDKGIKFGSLNLSTSTKNAKEESTLFTYFVDQQKSNLTIRLDGGYVFRENLAAGAGILYGYKKDYNTQRASDGTLTDFKSYERDFAFRPFIKNFIPLGNGHRFYVVIPTELQIGYGSKVTESTTNQILKRTFVSTNYYGLQMRPGLLAFIYENFGFEVNVGAFGLSTTRSKTSTTGQPDGEVKTNDLSLRIDILQLSLGFSLYFR